MSFLQLNYKPYDFGYFFISFSFKLKWCEEKLKKVSRSWCDMSQLAEQSKGIKPFIDDNHVSFLHFSLLFLVSFPLFNSLYLES